MKRMWLFAAAFMMAFAASAGQPDPTLSEECRIRDGLPNFYAKIKSGTSVNVAYLGGSITAAKNGWRSRTMAWFKKQYPQSDVHEINAAISGTGSDYGAIRLAGDVLAYKPDLIFVEFRVNGSSGYPYETVEGILRQTWKRNPKTDVCFIYTIAQHMLGTAQKGLQPRFGMEMETIANRYGVPSIDLGVEVAKRAKEGSLIFTSGVPVPGKLVFTKDTCHPLAEGHALYTEIISRSLQKIFVASAPAGDHRIPPAISKKIWETATLLPAAKILAGNPDWKVVDEENDPIYTNDKNRTRAMLRGAYSTQKEGATFKVRWDGITVGLSDIPQDREMIVDWVVDGTRKGSWKRIRTKEPRLHSRFWYLPLFDPGVHEVEFRVRTLPAGQTFYQGQFLIVGKPVE